MKHGLEIFGPVPGLPIRVGARKLAALTEDAATTAWVAQVVTNGGTVSAPRRALINTLIAGLKADAVWDSLDRLGILAAENAASELTDLKALTLFTITGAPTFTVDRGSVGTYSNLINTGWSPDDGPGWAQDSAHMMVYCNVDGVAEDAALIGGDTASHLYAAYTNSDCYARINNSTAGNVAFVGTELGSTIASRTASNLVTVYKAGSSIGTHATASAAVNTADVEIPWGGAPSTGRAAAYSVGAGLDATKAAALHARVLTFLTAIGAN